MWRASVRPMTSYVEVIHQLYTLTLSLFWQQWGFQLLLPSSHLVTSLHNLTLTTSSSSHGQLNFSLILKKARLRGSVYELWPRGSLSSVSSHWIMCTLILHLLSCVLHQFFGLLMASLCAAFWHDLSCLLKRCNCDSWYLYYLSFFKLLGTRFV